MGAVTEAIKRGLRQATEFGVLLVALSLVLYLLFGSSAPFIGASVAANLGNLFTALGENAMAGLVTIAVVFYLFDRRRAPA